MLAKKPGKRALAELKDFNLGVPWLLLSRPVPLGS